LNPCIFRYPPTPYFVEGVAPRDSGGANFNPVSKTATACRPITTKITELAILFKPLQEKFNRF
ncbi:MAG TPA: hypothetical protein DDZ80_27490, partial [Cyanobacteria bacterium UBA8803]|nr:hypothetical protein [Cyanobacteria bacterium UBA8803]